MKKSILFLFITGFIAGMIYTNFIAIHFLSQAGVFSDYFFQQLKSVQVSCSQLFFFLLKKRVRPFILFAVLGGTEFGGILLYLFSLVIGFFSSAFVSGVVLKQGIKGILIAAAALVPQMFFYALAYLLLCKKIQALHEKCISITKKERGMYLLLVLLLLIPLFIGIWTEAYLNPWILKKIL